MGLLMGKLDKNAPLPLHYQLRMLIHDHIKREEFRPGDCIPAEVEIMEQFSVSRNTVRQAINDLVKEGFLYRLPSKGTFVAKPKLTLNYMMAIESFRHQVERGGKSPSTAVIELKVIKDSHIASELKIDPNSQIIKLLRVRSVDGEPIGIVESYLPYDLCSSVMYYNFEHESLFDLLATNSATKVRRVERTVESTAATTEESKLLNIKKGFPMQSFINYAYTSNNRIIEFCLSRYKGDRNTFSVTIYNDDNLEE